MSSSHRKRSPVRLRSPLPDIPRVAPISLFSSRDSHTSNLSARSKAYRDTLRMPAMIPAPEDDDNNSQVVDGHGTLNSVHIKETYKERYMETDAAKANAEIGLPEVRIISNKLILPQPSSPKRNLGSIFGSVFSKHSSKGYSIENLTQVGHTPDLISSPKLLQQRHVMRLSDLETDERDESNVNHTPQQAKNKKRWSNRNISLVLVAIFLVLAVAGVAIAISQNPNPNVNGQDINSNRNGAPIPTALPSVSVSTASPLTSLPTRSPTNKPTKAPTKESTLAPTKKPTQAPTKESTSAPTQAPTLGSVTVDAASNLCDQTDENAFICINLKTFFKCAKKKKPDTSPGAQGQVILTSCTGETSCACAPLTQSLSSALDICAAPNSKECNDLD